jgi:uncharacterized protein (DUF2249 family)
MSLEIHQISSTPPPEEPAALLVHIRNAAVIDAIASHHATLAAELRSLTTAVLDGARSADFGSPRADLVAWFTTELLPHANAEEVALYSAGSLLESTRLLVDGMVAEHRALEALVTEVGDAPDPFAVIAAAASAQALFTVHLTKENDLLLPALDTAGADLRAALDGMREILGDPAHPNELDVRSLPHGGRHEVIFARLDELLPGEAFTILNDHDPKPLRYQTEALWPDRFTWTYLEAGPAIWRVAISRAD